MIAVENAYLYYSILQGAVLFYASMIMLVSSYMILRLLDKSDSEVLLSRFYDSLGASLKWVFARERLPVLAASLVVAVAAYWVSRIAFRGEIMGLLGGLYLASVFLSVALLGLAMYRRFVGRARLSQAVLAPIQVIFFLVVYYGSGTLLGYLGLFTYMFVVLFVVLLLIFAELLYSGVGSVAARFPVLGMVNVIPFLLAFMVVVGFVVYPLIGAASATRAVVDPGGVFPEYIHNVTFVSGGDGFSGHRDYYVVTGCTVLGVGDVDFIANISESMSVIYAEVPVVVVSESLAEGLGITGPTLFINDRIASFLGLDEGVHRGVEVRVSGGSFAADLRVVYGFSGLWTDTTTDPAVLHPLILLEHLKYYNSLVVVEGSAPVECPGQLALVNYPGRVADARLFVDYDLLRERLREELLPGVVEATVSIVALGSVAAVSGVYYVLGAWAPVRRAYLRLLESLGVGRGRVYAYEAGMALAVLLLALALVYVFVYAVGVVFRVG